MHRAIIFFSLLVLVNSFPFNSLDFGKIYKRSSEQIYERKIYKDSTYEISLNDVTYIKTIADLITKIINGKVVAMHRPI